MSMKFEGVAMQVPHKEGPLSSVMEYEKTKEEINRKIKDVYATSFDGESKLAEAIKDELNDLGRKSENRDLHTEDKERKEALEAKVRTLAMRGVGFALKLGDKEKLLEAVSRVDDIIDENSRAYSKGKKRETKFPFKSVENDKVESYVMDTGDYKKDIHKLLFRWGKGRMYPDVGHVPYNPETKTGGANVKVLTELIEYRGDITSDKADRNGFYDRESILLDADRWVSCHGSSVIYKNRGECFKCLTQQDNKDPFVE